MQIHTHDPTSPLLQHALHTSLPHSIPLLYRTQHPNRTPNAHILATFPCSATSLPRCWAAAYLDRSMRPETELWIFSTGEQPGHDSGSESEEVTKQEKGGFCKECKRGVLGLLDYMATLSVPDMHPENAPAMELARQHEKDFPTPPPSGRYELSQGTYMRHLLEPQVVTLGTCHDAIVQICREVGVLRTEFPGPNAKLNKFLFKISDLPETRELPEGLRWGEMREQDIDVVKARTSIPRSTRTLLSLKSVGVFEEETDTAVAWTFLGLDGSLTTLHTEEAYRGKGIAKAVAASIMRMYAPGLAVDPEGNAWSHADVYTDNAQSEKVCRSLGGEAMWNCFWVRIDLERAGMLAKNA